LIRYLLVSLDSFLFFRCLLVHDGATLRTIENPADLSRLRFVSQSLSSYGGGAAPAAVPGGPLAAPPPGFRPAAGEAAPSPPLGGVGRLFALLLLLLPLLGGHGLLLSAVGVAVGADVREGGRLPLGDLPVLLVYRRLLPLLVVARSPLSPPPRRATPCCRRWSGRRVPPRCSRASGRARGR